ncbi:hypothetical protein chiPu_0026351, partial [Chiloscyllium punctatum]|nr:hypothetical protein [Chiloscyllium punctatum]
MVIVIRWRWLAVLSMQCLDLGGDLRLTALELVGRLVGGGRGVGLATPSHRVGVHPLLPPLTPKQGAQEGGRVGELAMRPHGGILLDGHRPRWHTGAANDRPLQGREGGDGGGGERGDGG